VVSALPELDRCSDTEALLARRLDPIDPAAAIAVERVREAIADALAEQAAGHYARAFALAESALAKAEPLGHRSTIASARFALGSALDRMADPEPARKALLRAAQDAQAVGDDHLL